MPRIPKISAAEWEVLTVLWDRGAATAPEVHAVLGEGAGWHQKTVNTFLTRLAQKGVLAIRREGKLNIYKPKLTREQCVRRESESFLQRVLPRGDWAAARSFLRGSRSLRGGNRPTAKAAARTGEERRQMTPPFQQFLETSLFISFAILFFLPIRPLLRRWIGNQWLCILWFAILIRLLLPWPMETRWGMMSYWSGESSPGEMAPAPKLTVTYPTGEDSKVKSAKASTITSASSSSGSGWRLDVPFTIWLCGLLVAIGSLIWRWHRGHLLAAAASAAGDPRLLAIFSSIPATWRRNVELRVTDAISVPTLAGMVRPHILMPPSWPDQFADEELRAILLHEAGHARRGDLPTQCLFALAQCLHWFNPVVWLAARAARFDREMACDAWVLARSGDGASCTYGAALLKAVRLLRLSHCTPVAGVAMASSRNALRARIAGIGQFRPARIWPGLLATALAIGALALLTTKAQTPAATNKVGATPSASAPPATSGTGAQIKIETKFVEISEATWDKLCAGDTLLQKLAIHGNIHYSNPGDTPYVTNETELNKLGPDHWQLIDGSWNTSLAGAFASLLPDKETLKLLVALESNGSHLLSSPTVTTRANQRAIIEVVGKMHYPSTYETDKDSPGGKTPSNFVEKDIGQTLEVSPSLGSDGYITLDLKAKSTSFLGYLQDKDGKKEVLPGDGTVLAKMPWSKPIFSNFTSETRVAVAPGQSVLLGGVNFGKLFTDPVRRSRNVLLVVLVTPSIVHSDGSPVNPPSPTPAPIQSPNLPYAVPVNGKSGFVISPYAATGGMIDVPRIPQKCRSKGPVHRQNVPGSLV